MFSQLGTVRALFGHCSGTVRALFEPCHLPQPCSLWSLIHFVVSHCFLYPGVMLAFTRRRALQKRPDPYFGSQEPILGLPELGDETVGAKRQVYLITFPHPRPGSGCVAPSSMSRGALMTKLLRHAQHPPAADSSQRHATLLCSAWPQCSTNDTRRTPQESHMANTTDTFEFFTEWFGRGQGRDLGRVPLPDIATFVTTHGR